MPIIERYSAIKNGGIVFTGNTLGLSKAANAASPGVLGSIGAFISLDTSLQVSTFPAGTTLDYTKNGSAAVLNLPAGSTVLYAELVWGGLFRSSANDISALLDNPVEFITPSGSNSIAPDVSTKQNFNITEEGLTLGFYVRTANVTTLVKNAMNGTYSTGKVPALIEAIDARTSETNHAGWTLAVVYENASLPLRDLTVWSGGVVVSPSVGSTDITLTDFITPDSLPVTGKLFVSAQEGDAVLENDRLLFGQDTASLTPLSGPNNPVDNFFASQINDENGALDTSGTFGTRNANAAAGTNTSGCRQGWDITAVDVSSRLSAGQTAAAVRFETDGDLYVPNCLALQIDSKGASLQVKKSVDKTYAEVGEEIGYTLDIANTGSIEAETVVVGDLLPNDATLVPGSIKIDGTTYAGSLPITFGPLAAGASAKVEFSVRADAIPAQNPIFNVAQVVYTFSPFPGNTVTGVSNSNYAVCYIIHVEILPVKNVDKGVAASGEELLYTTVIANKGTLPVTNVYFTDSIPAGTTFVPGSVLVDGVAIPAGNPELGFPLPNLLPGQSTTVAFRVIVN
ncbi:MAG: DUF11 domain-containing protein [Clostridia bacterium]|nr:DUF11 domain-containing protein [Clostridia bacterium]